MNEPIYDVQTFFLELGSDNPIALENSMDRLVESKEGEEILKLWDYQFENQLASLEQHIVTSLAYIICLSNPLGVSSFGSHLIRFILRQKMKRVYRGLSSGQAHVIQSYLYLLTVMNASSTSACKELVQNFNFTLSVLPGFLKGRKSGSSSDGSTLKQDTRTMYIEFMLSFLLFGDVTTKKLFLEKQSPSTLTGLIKELKFAPYAIVQRVLDTLLEHVVRDEALPRQAKVGFFSSSVLQDLIKLYETKESNEGADTENNIPELIHGFMKEISLTPGQGICYEDAGWYPAFVAKNTLHHRLMGSNASSNTDMADATVDTSRIYNFLLMQVLHHLQSKLSTDQRQRSLALSILETCNELLLPFWTRSQFSFEPRSSLAYFSNVSMLTSVIRLPVPPFFGAMEALPYPPVLQKALAAILPSAMNRSFLVRGLQSTDLEIRYANARLLVQVFRKLDAVEHEIEQVLTHISQRSGTQMEQDQATQKWNAWYDSLRNELFVVNRMPDLQAIVSLTRVDKSPDSQGASISKEDLCACQLELLQFYAKFMKWSVVESHLDLAKMLPSMTDLMTCSDEMRHLCLDVMIVWPDFKWTKSSEGGSQSQFANMVQLYLQTTSTDISTRSKIIHLLTQWITTALLLPPSPQSQQLLQIILNDFEATPSQPSDYRTDLIKWLDAFLLQNSKNIYTLAEEVQTFFQEVGPSQESMDETESEDSLPLLLYALIYQGIGKSGRILPLVFLARIIPLYCLLSGSKTTQMVLSLLERVLSMVRVNLVHREWGLDLSKRIKYLTGGLQQGIQDKDSFLAVVQASPPNLLDADVINVLNDVLQGRVVDAFKQAYLEPAVSFLEKPLLRSHRERSNFADWIRQVSSAINVERDILQVQIQDSWSNLSSPLEKCIAFKIFVSCLSQVTPTSPITRLISLVASTSIIDDSLTTSEQESIWTSFLGQPKTFVLCLTTSFNEMEVFLATVRNVSWIIQQNLLRVVTLSVTPIKESVLNKVMNLIADIHGFEVRVDDVLMLISKIMVVSSLSKRDTLVRLLVLVESLAARGIFFDVNKAYQFQNVIIFVLERLMEKEFQDLATRLIKAYLKVFPGCDISLSLLESSLENNEQTDAKKRLSHEEAIVDLFASTPDICQVLFRKNAVPHNLTEKLIEKITSASSLHINNARAWFVIFSEKTLPSSSSSEESAMEIDTPDSIKEFLASISNLILENTIERLGLALKGEWKFDAEEKLLLSRLFAMVQWTVDQVADLLTDRVSPCSTTNMKTSLITIYHMADIISGLPNAAGNTEVANLNNGFLSVCLSMLRTYILSQKKASSHDSVVERLSGCIASNVLISRLTSMKSNSVHVDIPVALIDAFIKTVLKYRLTDERYMKLVPILLQCKPHAAGLSGNDLLSMITTHSSFEPLLTANSTTGNEQAKATILATIMDVSQVSSSVLLNPAWLPVLASAYTRSLSKSDQLLLALHQKYETQGQISILPYLKHIMSQAWGSDPWNAFEAQTVQSSIMRFVHSRDLDGLIATSTVTQGQGIYDHAFVLPWISFILSTDGNAFDLQKFIDLHLLEYVVICLGSLSPSVREASHFILARVLPILEHSDDIKAKSQYLTILNGLQNAIVLEDAMNQRCLPRIPGPFVTFCVQALNILSRPDSDLYLNINSFFLKRPVLDLHDIPMFYQLQFSSSDASLQERIWLLKLLAAGLNTAEDYKLFRRRHVLEILMGFYESPFADTQSKNLILEVVFRGAMIPSVVSSMITKSGLLLFLDRIVANDSSVNVYLPRLLTRIMQSFLSANKEWDGSVPRSIWIEELFRLAEKVLLSLKPALKSVQSSKDLGLFLDCTHMIHSVAFLVKDQMTSDFSTKGLSQFLLGMFKTSRFSAIDPLFKELDLKEELTERPSSLVSNWTLSEADSEIASRIIWHILKSCSV